jgi:hypothetical protein
VPNRLTSLLLIAGASVAFLPIACRDDDPKESEDDGGSGGARPSGGAGGKPSGGRTGTAGSAGNGGGEGGVGNAGGRASGDAGGAGDAGASGASTGGAGAGGATAGSGGDGGQVTGGSGGAGEPCPFEVDATINATIRTTTDDNYHLYVNGALIDDAERVWSQPQTYSVALFRHPKRENVLGIRGTNTLKIDGLDRGIILDLSFGDGGDAQTVVTDASWKLSTMLESEWFTLGFDDSSWLFATEEGAHGIAPYGAVLGTSSATWIWSYDANVAASEKPELEQVWVRKTFYIDAAGRVSDEPTACP